MSETSQAKIHDAAMIAHEANRAYCLTIGDSSQPDWKSAPNWQRDSAVAGAQAINDNPATTPEQSHEGWSAQKVADGWVYGEVKDAAAKTHPCLVPYDQLPEAQKVKDALFGSVVRAVLGIRAQANLANFDVVDGVEHRSVVDSLEGELDALRAQIETLRVPSKPPVVPTDSEGAES